MLSSVKAEFRKLLSVRSTYVIAGLALLMQIFLSFYVTGIRASDLGNPTKLMDGILGSISLIGLFTALIAVLLVSYEYRYNTITYTLTASNSRTKTLLAKVIAISIFGLLFTTLNAALNPLLTTWGVSISGHPMTHQVWDWGQLIWRTLFGGWGYAMAGLIIAVLLRSQVGSIAVLFIVPTTVETLLGIVLKKNTMYLPFKSLDGVLMAGDLTPAKSAVVFTAYLAVSLFAAWMLFLRRDAN